MKKENANKKIALVTGASGGIGMELARIHAENGGDLILVARSGDKLQKLGEELGKQYGTKVKIIIKDLSLEGAANEIFEEVQKDKLKVDYLINNAGFGGYGFFHERDINAEESMMKVNMLSLTLLTRLFLPQMIERKSGKILNVASTAGFVPGPLQAVYYATKAFVLSFSQAIDEELKNHGISVTALAPGPVNTNFGKEADLENSPIFKFAASARSVAEKGYKAMMKGKLVEITDARLRFAFGWVLPFMGRRTILKASMRSLQKK